MSSHRRHRHRRTLAPDEREHRNLIKGISVAAGFAIFVIVGVFLMVRGIVT